MHLVTIWQRIDQWDKWLFVKLNGQWTNSVFDAVFPYLRNSIIWAPLYLLIFSFVVFNYGKRGLWWCIIFLITVGITDYIGGQIKDIVGRVRPCQDHSFSSQVRFIVHYCPISGSFVSNHAANHFGLATYIFMSFKGVIKRWSWLAFAWAGLIAYAQVYVGVHYPTDVIGGALFGTMAGLLTAWLFHRNWGTFNSDNQLQ